MVTKNLKLDLAKIKKAQGKGDAGRANVAQDQWSTGTVVEALDNGLVAVELDGTDDDWPPVVAPADPGVTAVGAAVRVIRDSTGRVTHVAAPDVLPEDSTPLYVGSTGQFVKDVADAQVELDADLAQAREDIASAKQDVDHLQDEVIPDLNNQIKELDETTIPGLAGRVDEAEQKLSPLPGRISATESAISGAQEDLDNLNDVKLPALSEATKDAARLTEGTLDNDRLAIGELSALIANIIQLNVSQLVASDAAINSAVINKLSVGIANVISLSASQITSGQLDAARINVAELAVELATVIHLDVSQLVASNAVIDSAVISKLSVGIADVIELNVSRLVASDAHLGTAVAQRIVADTATFLKITTEMLIAGGAKITGPLLADTIQLATRLVAGDPAGDRTEINGSGIHIFKGGVERVRLSASAPNGLQVWNPSMSAMVDLSAAAFGAQILTHNPNLNIPVPSSQSAWGEWKPGAWVFQSLGKWTATTNRAQIFSTTSLGDAGVAQSFGVRVAFTMQPVGGGTEIPLTDTGQEYGAVVQRSSPNPNFGIFSCTPGTTYNVRLQAQAIRYASSPDGTPWIKNSQISLTPI